MTWRSPDTYHLAGHGRGTATLKFYEGRDILRLPVHVAQRRCLPDSGGEVGRAQRSRAASIYAKCVVGQDELAKRRISEALLQD